MPLKLKFKDPVDGALKLWTKEYQNLPNKSDLKNCRGGEHQKASNTNLNQYISYGSKKATPY